MSTHASFLARDEAEREAANFPPLAQLSPVRECVRHNESIARWSAIVICATCNCVTTHAVLTKNGCRVRCIRCILLSCGGVWMGDAENPSKDFFALRPEQFALIEAIELIQAECSDCQIFRATTNQQQQLILSAAMSTIDTSSTNHSFAQDRFLTSSRTAICCPHCLANLGFISNPHDALQALCKHLQAIDSCTSHRGI